MSLIKNTGKLKGLTVFITGASRGIGKEIGLKAAGDGANIVIAAKTAEPHPKLKGTIYTAAKEIEEAGGQCLPCVVDVRDEQQVLSAVDEAVKKFGGIDIVINNASAISLTTTLSTEMKKYDLMNQVNARGTFLVSKACLPYLKKSSHPHILNLSPPINLNPLWFKNHVAYTIAKYGMSMCALGMAEEFRGEIGVNCLWPRTAILTAAMEMLTGPDAAKVCRKIEIMSDSAYVILCKDPKTTTGNFFIDDELLAKEGITDFDHYLFDKSNKSNIIPDFFLDVAPTSSQSATATASSGDADEDKISNLFDVAKNALTAELVASTQAVFQFKTKDGKCWYMDLKNGSGSAGIGEAPSTVDTTLIASAKDHLDMMLGKLKPVNALMTGRLKIDGNMQKALKLEKLMVLLKTKL